MASAAYARLQLRYAEIRDLEHGVSLLGWDQEVMMPPGGAGPRAQALASLSAVVHERLTAPEWDRVLRQLGRSDAGLSPRQRRAVQLVARRVERARAVPAELARRIALHQSESVEAWRAARASQRFAPFAPALERMVELKRAEARALDPKGRPYDALLDGFEPGARLAFVEPLLDQLVALTRPLLLAVVASGVQAPTEPWRGPYDLEGQRRFVAQVTAVLGLDATRSRMDVSTHPFCSGSGPHDVRITTRYDEHDLRVALFGAIHETGHGLYEQGLDPRRARSPLGGAVSMAIHESQSRLWENQVARGRPFWEYWLPRLKRVFPRHPSLQGVNVETMVCAANAIQPSRIRVEADELTYNLHIVLRSRIERDLLEGSLQVRDLPERWNTDLYELLGVTPRHDGEGVLQDIHWAAGLFGYFPTYALGNLYAAQFMEAARSALPGLDRKLAAGDFSALREWLRVQIHGRDRLWDADRLVRKVTGRALDVQAFGRHIRGRVAALLA